MIRGLDINSLVKPLKECDSQVILTNQLQVADILDWILSQSGKADIFQSTFSVSEEFLRRLYFIRKDDKIGRATLIVDHKASNKTIKLWRFISNVYDKTFMADNHSKILLVKAVSGMKVSVVTSQNLTRGNRFESTLITTSDKIFDSLLKDFNFIADNKSVPIYELL